ncbi:MAG: MFS transporter [Devosia sp.]|uniref:MFS transporter n=1 Tax=Devosia sp. 66-22 TaxID=1895753 RepID=UPI0009279378|nr:MFS transporter [Devosia sp. 66-22]MBN9347517.1 MFS transporter [Devosia sp.]OJX54976.1 MAG: MFS transporter [Devosia sp. 66-22]
MKFGLDLAPHHKVFGAFGIYSFTMGNIFPRFADLKNAMGVEEGLFGLGLIGAPVGTLISLTFAPPLLEKIGYRRAILFLIPILSLFYAVTSLAPNPYWFFVLLVPVGLTLGCIEIILNLEADRTEHLVGRRIMNRAHGFWSFGFFAAGLVGGVIAQWGLSPQVHLFAIIPVSIIGTLLLLGRFEPAPARTGSHADEPKFAAPTAGIMALVAVTLSAMAMEGGYMDWSVIYMHDLYNSVPFTAALAVTLGALAQAITRFFADGFVERYSPVLVSRVLLGVMTVGIVLVFYPMGEWTSLLGFALLGIGSSAIFPLAMSAAAQRTDRPAAVNVAALAQTSFVTFLVAPPVLGFIAQHWGITWSFGIGLPLVILSFAFSHVLGRKPLPHKVD